MMKCHLLCLSLLLAILCQAQPQGDTIRLYYAIGSTDALSGLQRADSAIRAHRSASVSVALYGYADFLGAAAANSHLSQHRADEVKQWVLAKNYPNIKAILVCEGKGEQDFSQRPSPLGDPASRRVDVVLSYTPAAPVKDSAAPAPVVQEEAVKEKSGADEKDVTKLEVGEAMAIKGLNFMGGRHVLLPGSKEPLRALLAVLKKNPAMKVEIQGHVCCTDSEADGLDTDTNSPHLSENRAHAIYNFLIENGIDQSRLRYKGFGHSKPLVWPENNEEAMQANRRVEVMIISK